MTTTAAQTTTDYDRRIACIEKLVLKLNEALGLDPADYSNRVSFGYIGNCGPNYDDRSWYVFLPHPGRVGQPADRMGGFATGDAAGAATLHAQLSGAVTIARFVK